MRLFRTVRRPALMLALAWLSVPIARADIQVKDGDRVAFLGDSITAQGAKAPLGYVRLVESGLAANGVAITVIPAGISGHKSNQMLARLKTDR